MTRFSLDNTKHFLERQENISVETRQAILEAIKKYDFSCVIDDLNLIKNNIRLLLNQVIANLGIDLNFNLNLFALSIQDDYENIELKSRYILVIYNPKQHDKKYQFQFNSNDINNLTDDLDKRMYLAQNLFYVIEDKKQQYVVSPNDIIVTKGPLYDKLRQFVGKN